MRVFTTSAQTIREICRLLLSGEVVAIPTETVYGLAADALNPEAVEEIYRIKGRPPHNPLIVHIHDPAVAESYVHLNPVAQTLMDAFWPGPLTLVLPKKPLIPGIVTAELPTIGIRMPNHPSMLSILESIDRPLAAPSANPSNYISPTRVEHVIEGLEGKLKYVLDGGPCSSGMESTILDLSNPEKVTLLRPGPITISQIEKVIELSVLIPVRQEKSILTSPGQMKTHYCPRTPVTIGKQTNKGCVAWVHFLKSGFIDSASPKVEHFYLTRNQNPREAEANLYALLQQLDKGKFDEIVFDPVPEGEEWNAIQDRITRASSKK